MKGSGMDTMTPTVAFLIDGESYDFPVPEFADTRISGWGQGWGGPGEGEYQCRAWSDARVERWRNAHAKLDRFDRLYGSLLGRAGRIGTWVRRYSAPPSPGPCQEVWIEDNRVQGSIFIALDGCVLLNHIQEAVASLRG